MSAAGGKTTQSDLAKKIREMIEKATKLDDPISEIIAAMKVPKVLLTAKCRACGQKNRWQAGRAARCGKCGFPLREGP